MRRILYIAGRGDHPSRHRDWIRRIDATRAAIDPLLLGCWERVDLEEQKEGQGVSGVIAEVTLWDFRIERVLKAATARGLPMLSLYLSTLPLLSEGRRPPRAVPYRAAHNAAAHARLFLASLPHHPPVNLLAPPPKYSAPPHSRWHI